MKVILFFFLFMFFSLTAAEKSDFVDSSAGETDIKTVGTKPESDISHSRSTPLNEEGYDIKLKNLEEKINSLKDKIVRSKQRLAVLQESVTGGTIAETKVSIVHRNTINSFFRLISAVFYFDDKQIFSKSNASDELTMPEIVIYDATVTPGTHNISVFYVFEGKRYGVFSYLKDYTLKINAEYTFSIDEGNKADIVVLPIDKGGEYNFNNRLYIKFDMNGKLFDLPYGGGEATPKQE